MRKWMVVAAIALVQLGCVQGQDEKKSDAMVLRTYRVPKQSSAKILGVLKSVLWFSEGKDTGHWAGHPELLPNGDLIVIAPEAVQAGVQQIVDDAVKNPIQPNRNFEMRYWLVLGHPAPAASSFPGAADIQPALDEISKSQGPQAFTLLDRFRVDSIGTQDGEASSPRTQITQTVWDSGDIESIAARIKISVWPFDPPERSRLDTYVRLKPDQLLVLGEAGYQPPKNAPAVPEGTTLYYVVRAVPSPVDGAAK